MHGTHRYYDIGQDRWRPRHVHIRVQAPGHTTLVSQIYFTGDKVLAAEPSIPKDLIVPLRLHWTNGSAINLPLDQLSRHTNTCSPTTSASPKKCKHRCQGKTCDEWQALVSQTCREMESVYGCDCDGCACSLEPDAPDGCTGSCGLESFTGDGNCDDANNNCGCRYDDGAYTGWLNGDGAK